MTPSQQKSQNLSIFSGAIQQRSQEGQAKDDNKIERFSQTLGCFILFVFAPMPGFLLGLKLMLYDILKEIEKKLEYWLFKERKE